MINRTIIRIKILQVIYSYYQKEGRELKLAENELIFSIQKSYDLYHYLLFLIVFLTNTEQRRLDIRKQKYLATEAERNPDTRFINNRFAIQLGNNESLLKFVGEKGVLWNEEPNLVKTLLDRIIDSDIYKEYLTSTNTYDSDREFWRKIFKEFIYVNEDLEDFLEDKSLYWNDDMDIIGTFVLKTIKRFDFSNGGKQELLPMFRDDEDRIFATSLLRTAILKEKEYNERIIKHIKNWDVDRIAMMDLYIMQIAIAEIINYPSIPVRVSLNEYIDIAKIYSTPKSGTFINGILDVIVNDLKSEQLLFKN
jgi:N utilization substance protein B